MTRQREVTTAFMEMCDLVLDMDASGTLHGANQDGPCDCDRCAQYRKARKLADKYAALYTEMMGSK